MSISFSTIKTANIGLFQEEKKKSKYKERKNDTNINRVFLTSKNVHKQKIKCQKISGPCLPCLSILSHLPTLCVHPSHLHCHFIKLMFFKCMFPSEVCQYLRQISNGGTHHLTPYVWLRFYSPQEQLSHPVLILTKLLPKP